MNCENCNDTGDVHSLDGEWRGICSCPAGKNLSKRKPTAFTDTQIAAIASTVNDWDDDKSIKRASEELLELALVLLHLDRGKATITDVKLEMADVRIALQHLELKVGNYQAELDAKVIKGNPQ
ncbi:hypothetical protein DV711_06325 [Motiliproteus coralliicola]|uniref:Uncharacterized protein n=1 Tax=Motiliproteus coralliicola TaxID=2283196 RepID=A0A369WVV2_9GAMM|nr:hypothetical protein [Motiliproteus coralliicola]RDE25169.1 hypothetical protein DV711_06325 [Motiliproteus coralliicola]